MATLLLRNWSILYVTNGGRKDLVPSFLVVRLHWEQVSRTRKTESEAGLKSDKDL